MGTWSPKALCGTASARKGENERMLLNRNAGKPVFLRRSLYPFLFAFMVCMSLGITFPAAVYAHPPKEVSLAYDAQKQVLSVTITHSSFFPSKHYIKSVDISRNGTVVTSVPYTSQPAGDTFTYTYPVPASPGDELSVNASCSIFGSRGAKLAVPK